ncbi:MAG TPA: beta/gamma crystallin-related protein [Usitatibacter sp.]|nr:beta/gamma crystallin-related protein [Usitatibacter sp.]
MNWKLRSALGASALLVATQALAQITFYEGEGFRGHAFTTDKSVGDFSRAGFNDRASSVVVDHGRWEACEDARFGGRCVVLKKGSYESLGGMGLDNKVSSVRPVNAGRRYDNEAPEPLAAPTYDYRRRPNERTYEARVTSVREVRGPPEERCWIEHRGDADTRGQADSGAAIAGALIGGILGHQAGDDSHEYGRNVHRCETRPSGAPAYWDVTYDYRGKQHRMQMGAAPGATVSVNSAGEPRG